MAASVAENVGSSSSLEVLHEAVESAISSAAAAPTMAAGCGARSRSRSAGRHAAEKKKKNRTRSKKGWTCYTRFFMENVDCDGIELNKVR